MLELMQRWDPEEQTHLCAELPSAIWNIFVKATARKPEARHRDVIELRREFIRVFDESANEALDSGSDGHGAGAGEDQIANDAIAEAECANPGSKTIDSNPTTIRSGEFRRLALAGANSRHTTKPRMATALMHVRPKHLAGVSVVATVLVAAVALRSPTPQTIPAKSGPPHVVAPIEKDRAPEHGVVPLVETTKVSLADETQSEPTFPGPELPSAGAPVSPRAKIERKRPAETDVRRWMLETKLPPSGLDDSVPETKASRRAVQK